MHQTKRLIYKDLGFPITLIDVPIKKIMGEEVLDIDLHKLQLDVLKILIFKSTPLTGDQLRFIRKYLEMTTTEFAKKFGVTHPTVLKWEKRQTKINATTEFYIRLHLLQYLQNNDLRKLCTDITVEKLVAQKSSEETPIEIDDFRLSA